MGGMKEWVMEQQVRGLRPVWPPRPQEEAPVARTVPIGCVLHMGEMFRGWRYNLGAFHDPEWAAL